VIIKSLSRRSGTRQVLNYLFKDKGKLINAKGKTLTIRHNVRGRSLERYVKEFQTNEGLRINRRSNSVEVYHTVLSFSSKDKEHITEGMLRDIGREYIRQRGEDNMFVGVAHFTGTEHIHLHMVMAGCKYMTGESNRQSRAEFRELKLAMDDYQREKYPELTNSLPEHGKAKEHTLSIRETQKETLLETLNAAYSNSKSLDDFLEQVRAMGHEPYTRGGKVTGIKFQGERKFRFQTLGYDKDKIAKLEAQAETEKAELEELNDIRERSNDRELETDERERELRDDRDNDEEEDEEVDDDDDSEDDDMK
jgi:Relaxase/Mobilisation nuclease domain